MSEHRYTTVDTLKGVVKQGLDSPPAVFEQAIDTATESIDNYCGRRFDQVVAVGGVARIFPVELDTLVGPTPSMAIDDVLPVDGQAITVETTRTPTADAEWVEEPSGWWLGPNPRKEGWPYTEFYVRDYRRWANQYVRITTSWGWEEIPSPVARACLMMASRTIAREDSPLGQMMGEYGAVYVRTVDPDIKNWIRPYKRAYLLD